MVRRATDDACATGDAHAADDGVGAGLAPVVGRYFPLIARPRPRCTPVAERATGLRQRAGAAARDGDVVAASVVFNLAALLASDVGLPDLARTWCRRQVALLVRTRGLDPATARLALEPVINLARLETRAGHGARAAEHLHQLGTAVAAGHPAVIDGIEIPADLVADPAARHELYRQVWPALLATTAHALASVGDWAQAHARLRTYRGVGNRMLDGRQIAVLDHLTAGDPHTALALIDTTHPGEPWETVVTACLRAHCNRHADPAAERAAVPGAGAALHADRLLHGVATLDTVSPALVVFHTRLGLAALDALDVPDPPGAAEVPAGPGYRRARELAGVVARRVLAVGDGYAARDLLAHPVARTVLTGGQTNTLTTTITDCRLDQKTLPHTARAEIDDALNTAEHIIESTFLSRRIYMP